MPNLLVLACFCCCFAPVLPAESLLAVDLLQAPCPRAVCLDGRFFAGNQTIAMWPARQENWSYHMRTNYRDTPAILVAQTGVSLQHGAWGLALLQRRQAYIEATSDTWKLARERRSMQAGTEYSVAFAGDYFAANAVRLAHAWTAGTWSAGLAGSYLNGMRYRREYGVGHAIAANAEDVSARVEQERQDSRLNTGDPERFNTYLAAVPVDGKGFGFDAAFGWKPAPAWHLALAAADIGGRIHWQGMPSIARTGEFAFGADGSFIGRPDGAASVVERDARLDFRQRLPLKLAAAAEYAGPEWLAELRVEKIKHLTLPQIALAYPLRQGARLRVAYESRFGSWGVGVIHRWLTLSIRSNDVRLSHATALGATALLLVPF